MPSHDGTNETVKHFFDYTSSGVVCIDLFYHLVYCHMCLVDIFAKSNIARISNPSSSCTRSTTCPGAPANVSSSPEASSHRCMALGTPKVVACGCISITASAQTAAMILKHCPCIQRTLTAWEKNYGRAGTTRHVRSPWSGSSRSSSQSAANTGTQRSPCSSCIESPYVEPQVVRLNHAWWELCQPKMTNKKQIHTRNGAIVCRKKGPTQTCAVGSEDLCHP